MADFSLGSNGTGHLTTSQNWNSSTQVSYHHRLWVTVTGSAFNSNSCPWSGNAGGVGGSGGWSYPGSGTRNYNLWEFDWTYNKDANGYLTINVSGSINGNNAPYVGSGSTNYNVSPARIGVAPSIASASVTNRTDTTATLNETVSNNGLGTSVTDTMFYKKTSDGSWTQTGTTTGTGAKSFNITGLQPNRAYHYLARATNNNGDVGNLPASYPSASYIFYTLAKAATIGTITPLATTATMPYTQDTDGGAYTITTKYRIKTAAGAYGDWVNASGGTISLVGLLPNTEYVIQTRSSTTAGDKDGAEYNFTTLPAGKLVYPNGDVKNAITRLVYPDDTPTEMVNITLVREE